MSHSPRNTLPSLALLNDEIAEVFTTSVSKSLKEKTDTKESELKARYAGGKGGVSKNVYKHPG